MDFKQKIQIPYSGSYPMPISLYSYPNLSGIFRPFRNRNALRDFEYLQRTYSEEIREYQKKIKEVLDRMDYEGSMIYDEYPDLYSMRDLADTVVNIISRQNEPKVTDTSFIELIQVLVCEEIFKRRRV